MNTEPEVLWEATGKPIIGIGAGRFRLTKDLLYFEKGALSMKAQQIATHEIHDVDASQTLTQKARGVGNITLAAVRTTGRETVVIEDVPSFREGVKAINEAAHAARDEHRRKQQTQNVNYAGSSPSIPTATTPDPDLNAELSKLAAFLESGVLSPDEFTAAKKKLLGL